MKSSPVGDTRIEEILVTVMVKPKNKSDDEFYPGGQPVFRLSFFCEILN
jgi:hypothetical protein